MVCKAPPLAGSRGSTALLPQPFYAVLFGSFGTSLGGGGGGGADPGIGLASGAVPGHCLSLGGVPSSPLGPIACLTLGGADHPSCVCTWDESS